MYIIAAFVIVFTALAGMASVAYMDVAIGLLVTVALIVSLPILLRQAGGVAGLHAALPATHFQVLGSISFARAMEFFLPTMLLMLGNQAMYQKFFSAKSERDARVAVVGWVIGTVILETIIVAIAVIGSALYRTGEVAIALVKSSRIRPRTGCQRCWARCCWAQCSPRSFLPRTIIFFLRQRIWSTMFFFATCVRMPATRHSAGFAAGSGGAGHLGAGTGSVHGLDSGKSALCLHRLFGGADAGDSGSVLFSAHQLLRRRRLHWCGHFRHGFLGYRHRASPSTDHVCHRDAIFPALVASLICLFAVSWLTPPPQREKVAQFLYERHHVRRRTIGLGVFS